MRSAHRHPAAMIITLGLASVLLAAVVIQAGCGTGGSSPEGNADNNFGAREALTNALGSDRALDENARQIIRMVTGGQYTIDQGLDRLVDINQNLLSLIADVSAPARPGNTKLARAQKLMGEYLRNRIHQMEAGFSATSGAQLEQLYNRDGAGLNVARNQVRDLMLSYDPGLKNDIPP